MASPFPNFEVGDIVDVSLTGGGIMNNVEITYVPLNSPNMSEIFWEFLDPKTGNHAIVGDFVALVKKP